MLRVDPSTTERPRSCLCALPSSGGAFGPGRSTTVAVANGAGDPRGLMLYFAQVPARHRRSVLLGTGAGIAFFMLLAHRTGDPRVVRGVARIVVIADLVFTTTAVVVQPMTGVALIHYVGYGFGEHWNVLSIVLNLLTGLLAAGGLDAGTHARSCGGGGRRRQAASGTIPSAVPLVVRVRFPSVRRRSRHLLVWLMIAGRLRSGSRRPSSRSGPLTRAVERPATEDHRCAPDQEADIPVDPLLPRDRLVDVVQAKQMVVDHALNDVEEYRSRSASCRREASRTTRDVYGGRSAKARQAKHDEDVGRGMEEPVEECVDLEVLHAVRRIPGARDHVMPLQHLVQHDAVEEPAEPESEKDAG